MRLGLGEILSSHLRLPLGALFRLLAIWDAVEERFSARLTTWK